MEEGDEEWVFQDEGEAEEENNSSGDESGWRFLNEWADALTATAAEKEDENTPFLTQEEIGLLKKHSHVFDYTFSEEEKRFLAKNGYLVVKKAVPKETCDRMAEEIVERAKLLCGLNQNDPTTWAPVLEDVGFLDIWHGKTYYEIRQSPILYSVFAQLLRCHDLTLGMDRVSLKPPAYVDVVDTNGIPEAFIETAEEVKVEGSDTPKKRVWFKQPNFNIHNDMNLWDLSECKYQGGLALQDCPKGAGGFRCIPGFHKLEKIRRYRERYEFGEFHRSGPQPPPKGSFVWFLDEEAIKKETVEVEMEAGDFVIWNSRLPHSSCRNLTGNWRVHCFVRFMRSDLHEKYRNEVKDSVLTGAKPLHYSTGENSTEDKNRKWEVPYHQLPELTWLGKRVLGIEDFEKEHLPASEKSENEDEHKSGNE